jgi:hypothetical protein
MATVGEMALERAEREAREQEEREAVEGAAAEEALYARGSAACGRPGLSDEAAAELQAAYDAWLASDRRGRFFRKADGALIAVLEKHGL